MREARGRGRESEIEWGGGWIEEGFCHLKFVHEEELNVCVR